MSKAGIDLWYSIVILDNIFKFMATFIHHHCNLQLNDFPSSHIINQVFYLNAPL